MSRLGRWWRRRPKARLRRLLDMSDDRAWRRVWADDLWEERGRRLWNEANRQHMWLLDRYLRWL